MRGFDTRLKRLEKRRKPGAAVIAWVDEEADRVTVSGEPMTVKDFERRYPGRPVTIAVVNVDIDRV